jgi:hypothetical protein
MAFKMILSEGLELVKVCADLTRNSIRLLTRAFKLPEIDIVEAAFILYNCALWVLFLCKKFGHKPVEEKPESSDIEEYPDFPFEEDLLGEEKLTKQDPPHEEFKN